MAGNLWGFPGLFHLSFLGAALNVICREIIHTLSIETEKMLSWKPTRYVAWRASGVILSSQSLIFTSTSTILFLFHIAF